MHRDAPSTNGHLLEISCPFLPPLAPAFALMCVQWREVILSAPEEPRSNMPGEGSFFFPHCVCSVSLIWVKPVTPFRERRCWRKAGRLSPCSWSCALQCWWRDLSDLAVFDLSAAQSLTNHVVWSGGVAALQKEVGARRDRFHLQLFQQVSSLTKRTAKVKVLRVLARLSTFSFPKQSCLSSYAEIFFLIQQRRHDVEEVRMTKKNHSFLCCSLRKKFVLIYCTHMYLHRISAPWTGKE